MIFWYVLFRSWIPAVPRISITLSLCESRSFCAVTVSCCAEVGVCNVEKRSSRPLVPLVVPMRSPSEWHCSQLIIPLLHFFISIASEQRDWSLALKESTDHCEAIFSP